MNAPIAIVFGTRPEAIKLAPVIYELKRQQMPLIIINTGQHKELTDDACALFDIVPDYDFHIMQPGQDLSFVTHQVLNSMSALLQEISPAAIIVQGDTTTAFAAGLAAFYNNIPVVHVEAGLRSYDINAPFPEEFNRIALSAMATLHCAPTEYAAHHLNALQPPQHVVTTGNTVVDALFWIKERIDAGIVKPSATLVALVNQIKQSHQYLLLLTMHRRESFGQPMISALKAFKNILQQDATVSVIFPAHPNPQVQEAIRLSGLQEEERCCVLEPLSYLDMVYLLSCADFIATDSGGLCEEAISLSKPVLILRDKTERIEAVRAGAAQLVGIDMKAISAGVHNWLQKPHDNTAPTLYGDGKAAEKIVAAIKDLYGR